VLPHILSVLTHLFNFIITSSSFHTTWKTAIVLPLPKSRAPIGPADILPISILPVLSKGGLRGFCVISSLYILSLVVFCHVFRRFHSTATALTSIMDDIIE
jgi:hypothetical protein